MSNAGSIVRTAVKPALLVVGLTAGALSLEFLPFKAFLTLHAGAGVTDAAWFIVVGALACAFGLPRQIVAFAGGYAWGLWIGIALALVAQIIGAAADLFWARIVARDWVQARLKGRVQKLDRMLSRRPFAATVALRFMPIGNNLLLNLLAGVSAVPVAGFLAGSLLGFVPQTVIFALLGSGSRVAQGAEIALGVALFVVSAVIGAIMLRRRSIRLGPVAPGCAVAEGPAGGSHARG
ncbi:MAG: TVP38/TMEM64 family protein [Acetobacteraceae bacterium]